MHNADEQQVLYDAIFTRKSIRKYSPDTLDEPMLERVLAAADKTEPLDGAPVKFRLLTRAQVKKPFGDAPYYLAVYAADDDASHLAAAFRLQQMNLWFSANGMGSCWLGMAAPVTDAAQCGGLPFSLLVAFGLPAETLHRTGREQFRRKALSEITDLTGMDELLEAVRLAPSAVNRQGWFVTGGSNAIRLFMQPDGALIRLMASGLWRADAGIALCHLWLAARQAGRYGGFEIETGSGTILRNLRYVRTMRLKD